MAETMGGAKRTERQPEDFLPLTQTTFYILLSLKESAKHGYAILGSVEELSNGTVRLGVGNLYTALKRLLDSDMISRVERPDEAAPERQKVYKLSGLGETVLSAETVRILQQQAAARRVGAAVGVAP